jgi:hypothetical protein
MSDTQAREPRAPAHLVGSDPAQLVREIVAWFDALKSKYTSSVLLVEWPTDWLRRARTVAAPSEGEKL